MPEPSPERARKRPESWEAVARALGDRLEYRADNCPVGYFSNQDNPRGVGSFNGEPGEHHDPDKAAAECPFCADTIAYRRFVARTRGERYEPSATPGEARGS